MTYHLLNINDEATPSLLLGDLKARDGTSITILYELQEGSFGILQPYLNELLESAARALGVPETDVVLAYHRLRYSGVWYQCKPMLEIQDTQSLDFLGFDADDVRMAARETRGLSTIHVRLDALAKDTNKEALFGELDSLWGHSSDVDDFKRKIAAWSQSPASKAAA